MSQRWCRNSVMQIVCVCVCVYTYNACMDVCVCVFLSFVFITFEVVFKKIQLFKVEHILWICSNCSM